MTDKDLASPPTTGKALSGATTGDGRAPGSYPESEPCLSNFEIERDAIIDLIPRDRVGDITNPRMRRLAFMLLGMSMTMTDLLDIRREVASYKLKHDAAMEKRDAFFRNVASRYAGDSPQTPQGQAPCEPTHKENT